MSTENHQVRTQLHRIAFLLVLGLGGCGVDVRDRPIAEVQSNPEYAKELQTELTPLERQQLALFVTQRELDGDVTVDEALEIMADEKEQRDQARQAERDASAAEEMAPVADIRTATLAQVRRAGVQQQIQQELSAEEQQLLQTYLMVHQITEDSPVTIADAIDAQRRARR